MSFHQTLNRPILFINKKYFFDNLIKSQPYQICTRQYCNIMSSTATKINPSPEEYSIPSPEGLKGESVTFSVLWKDKSRSTEQQAKPLVDAKAVLKSWKWLKEFGPGFPVAGHKIRIIHSPDDFYSCLVDKSREARQRISLASLYLGSGLPEQKLIEVIEKNGTENPNLKIKVLLDYTRGSRGSDNSRTMLIPLINNCHHCNVYLYHTPALRGLVKRWLPQRWNEIIGLQHMKIYIFDDSLIISGANLSTDYFTNRQDRYILLEDCKDLADFYDNLIHKVSDFSFKLDGKNTASLKSNWKIHPSDGDYNSFVSNAKDHIVSFYDKCRKENKTRLESFCSQCDDNLEPTKKEENTSDDTWIFPFIQMGSIGISYDKDATCKVFENAPAGSHIKLATGYFNLTAEYTSKILQNSNTSYDILMAHPKANGFFGAKGFAGGIPAAYTLLAKQFLENASSNKQLYRISMREYIRQNWTYHAKGLWYYPPKGNLPVVTLIGSPNFGHRSVYRDLETQLYLITLNKKLQEQLEAEQQHLYNTSKPFLLTELGQPSRIVPIWVRMVIMFFRNFF